ncbi:hypothetical protein ACQ4WX_21720 [Streptomyces lasalocidi]
MRNGSPTVDAPGWAITGVPGRVGSNEKWQTVDQSPVRWKSVARTFQSNSVREPAAADSRVAFGMT